MNIFMCIGSIIVTSLFLTQLRLHSPTVSLIFEMFVFPSIYKEAVVCQNISQVTIQCTSVTQI